MLISFKKVKTQSSQNDIEIGIETIFKRQILKVKGLNLLPFLNLNWLKLPIHLF